MVALSTALATVAGCAEGGGDRPGPADGSMDAGGRDSGATVDAGCPTPCAEDEVCRLGRCLQRCGPDTECTGGGTCCGDVCVDTDSDQLNCGACGMTCPPAGNTCAAGACRCGTGEACEAGETCCGGSCAVLDSSPDHCGSCGVTCDTEEGEECVAGVCMLPACSPACAPGETCVDEACKCGGGAPCEAGRGCCGGACINTDSDPNNCGGCGITCTGEQTCVAGTCTTDVPCEPACKAGESCVGGTCMCGSGAACTGSQKCCDGSCVDTSGDVANCGACGRTCPSSDSCCSGSCINTNVTTSHCGGCGNACDSERANGCTDGSCTCDGEPACLLPGCFTGLGCAFGV